MSQAQLVLVANAGDGSISTFRFTGDGLEPLAVTGDLKGCSTFAIDAARDLVYAAVKGDVPGIATLSLDRETGALTALSRRPTPDGGMNYLALTRGGTALLGVSYGGGYGIAMAVDAIGQVSEPTARISFPNLHSVLSSPDGRFAYFVSLGADLVAQYELTDGLELRPLDPETVNCPVGSGPRHLVLDAAGDNLYVLTEFSAEVLHFSRDPDSGRLTAAGSATAYDTSSDLGHSTFGADPMANHLIWGADLHLGVGGRYLWCTERTESAIAAVGIEADGTPVAATSFTETEPQPRGFGISPDGVHLVVAGERSTTVSLYRADGPELTLLQQAETGRGANWVRFV